MKVKKKPRICLMTIRLARTGVLAVLSQLAAPDPVLAPAGVMVAIAKIQAECDEPGVQQVPQEERRSIIISCLKDSCIRQLAAS
jgi:hypothetical protein